MGKQAKTKEVKEPMKFPVVRDVLEGWADCPDSGLGGDGYWGTKTVTKLFVNGAEFACVTKSPSMGSSSHYNMQPSTYRFDFGRIEFNSKEDAMRAIEDMVAFREELKQKYGATERA